MLELNPNAISGSINITITTSTGTTCNSSESNAATTFSLTTQLDDDSAVNTIEVEVLIIFPNNPKNTKEVNLLVEYE